jgi:transcription antitermination factor NusG
MVRDELVKAGMECFLPLMSRISQWKEQNKRVEWPVFPGFCFVKLSDQQQCIVAEIAAVIGIVRDSLGKPVTIPKAEITVIQRLMKSGGLNDRASQRDTIDHA